jgi:hypothetical protein
MTYVHHSSSSSISSSAVAVGLSLDENEAPRRIIGENIPQSISLAEMRCRIGLQEFHAVSMSECEAD